MSRGRHLFFNKKCLLVRHIICCKGSQASKGINNDHYVLREEDHQPFVLLTLNCLLVTLMTTHEKKHRMWLTDYTQWKSVWKPVGFDMFFFLPKETVMVVHSNPLKATKPQTHKVIFAGIRRRMVMFDGWQ